MPPPDAPGGAAPGGGAGASAEGRPARRAPSATYRLQLHPGFGFDDATAVLGYLAELGVSHVYCSPYLQAAPGSTHGYDAIDPTRVSAELGGPAAHRRFCQALGEHGLGQILDIVPNHLAAVSDNPWWWDVLENGRAARHAHHFDIDWDPTEAKLTDRVLLPVLGDQYGRILEDGQLQLARTGGTFEVRYHDHRFPLSPRSADTVLTRAAERTGSEELAFLAHSVERLPLPSDDPEAVHERHRDKEILARMLDTLLSEEPEVGAAVDQVVAEVNASADELHALLERQNYRLAHWRTATHELDYRRFFDISTLVGLRIEEEAVFRDVHGLVLGWLADGTLDGVRVDHPDGLRDPEQYVRRLRSAAGGDAWIVIEKILSGPETLPEGWPVDGTTGYEFLNRLTWLFVDPDGLAALDADHRAETGDDRGFAEVALQARLEVLRTLLAADVERITNRLVQVAERHRRVRDVARAELREAVVELAASFDVYRTYGRLDVASSPHLSEADAARIAAAVAAATERRPDLDAELLAFVGRVLALEVPGSVEHSVALRFQQLTGPAMAKGIEDTAFYRSTRLLALNEVGGEPDPPADAVGELHAHNADVQARWPRAMRTTSTHDTKRSEDVRARLVLLTQDPDGWARARAALDAAAVRAGLEPPEPSVRWWVWQLLVGAHPVEAPRMTSVIEKSLREAKLRTSWLRPDEAYEATVQAFVSGALQDGGVRHELDAVVAGLGDAAMATSLAQVLLKVTSPGVPDLYQGSEMWDLSLVDPDNRRPVDYDRRREALAGLEPTPGPGAAAAWAERADGRVKLLVTRVALAARAAAPDAFGPQGSYRPLETTGTGGSELFGFARVGPSSALAVVVPRFATRAPSPGGVVLPAGTWRDLFTGRTHAGGEVARADLLDGFPVALLERVAS